MLKSVDVLIGLSVVMLVLSMVLTLVTEAVTRVLNSRGRHLLAGLADLLQQIDPGFTRATANAIAGAVLTHPMIRDAGQRYGSVVHREEFTKILLELATDPGRAQLQGAAKDALKSALAVDGIQDPQGVLDNVRSVSLQLEAERPDLAQDVRQNMALLREANSKFLGKIHGWFDQTIDRVSARFTLSTRVITLISAAILVVVIQLDTVSLVNRLASDQSFRSQLVQEGMKLSKTPPDISTAEGQQEVAQLSTAQVVTIPATVQQWKGNWGRKDAPPTPAGVLLSALLLSLGAPFWYNALKDTIKLRSVVSATDDAQRAIREQSQAPPGTPVAPTAA